ncbi:MAG: dihydroxy-acid dehydratase, partial [Alphaproteobacteria bacterium]|nr:dihydroxy-acid dehydratase [Alphaproteobacteria bacterium]
ELGDLLHMGHVGVSGQPLSDVIATAECWNRDVIRTVEDPLQAPGSGTAVLRGNLCPDGAVIKQSAASPHLMKHRGQALVFDSIEEYHQAATDPALPADEATVLVLRGAGPKGAPGMPEAGYLPIPRKLARQGIKDMVRISDARMSGTAYGAVVLHVAPEAAAGGPLALVRNGDRIRLSVSGRRLDLLVDEAELSQRKAEWVRASALRPRPKRGYAKLYMDSVLQADAGCDFSFLRAVPGAAAKP